MTCQTGRTLSCDFHRAIVKHSEACEHLQLALDDRGVLAAQVSLTKLEHSRALVDWITHRAFCIDCRTHRAVAGEPVLRIPETTRSRARISV